MKGGRLAVEDFLAAEFAAASVYVLHQLVVSTLGQLLLEMLVVVEVAVVLIFKNYLLAWLRKLPCGLLGGRVLYLFLYFIETYLFAVGYYCVFLPVEFL